MVSGVVAPAMKIATSIAAGSVPAGRVQGSVTAHAARPAITWPSLSPDPDPTKYYATAQGKQGADLVHALHMIVRTGHIDSGYAQARDGLFGLVFDDNNDNRVADVYSGRIESKISDRKTAFNHGLNTEHTWPQSLGARGIAQSDLHQLLPADIKINQIRGNMPYGIVKDVEWSSDAEGDNRSLLGTDERGTRVFQPPVAIRGDIARGLLYFYVRYNESRPADYSLENFRHELPVLLQWAKEDPVSGVEQLRNERIFNLQHNRNPFVDHPEWIDSAFTGIKI